MHLQQAFSFHLSFVPDSTTCLKLSSHFFFPSSQDTLFQDFFFFFSFFTTGVLVYPLAHFFLSLPKKRDATKKLSELQKATPQSFDLGRRFLWQTRNKVWDQDAGSDARSRSKNSWDRWDSAPTEDMLQNHAKPTQTSGAEGSNQALHPPPWYRGRNSQRWGEHP